MLVFSSLSMAYADLASPRQQMSAGSSAEDVQCNVGLQLMIKFNGDAACVKPSTASRLAAADWGTIQGDVVTELPVNDETMELEENVSLEEEESESEEEKASYKVELTESMAMGN